MRTEMGLKIIISNKMRNNPKMKGNLIISKWQMIDCIRKHTIKKHVLPSYILSDWVEYDNFWRGWEYGFAFDGCRQFKWYKFLFPKFRKKFKGIQKRRLSLARDILYNHITEGFDKLIVATKPRRGTI